MMATRVQAGWKGRREGAGKRGHWRKGRYGTCRAIMKNRIHKE